MKNALLAVSFGVTDPEVDRRCIRPIEAVLQAAFPDREVRRAFTSQVIVDRLRERGEPVPTVEEALARLEEDGFDSIAVAPLFMIPGGEYDRVCEAAGYLKIAGPLLDSDADQDRIARLLTAIAEEEKRPLLMMGHGTDHAADEIYERLRKHLPANVFLACLEGAYTLETALHSLEALPERTLTVMPLMLTTGHHARRHLTGDHPASWKSRLEARGFDVRVRMQGLGELETVQQMFAEKLLQIL